MKQLVLIALLFLTACTTKQQSSNSASNDTTTVNNHFSPDNKKVIVYTTAENTKDLLTITDSLHFKSFGQPLESQVCIFVDPSHTFQTFLGIGGAITDAAAETFYKLPKDKQKEILQAYYDTTSGIGYTLARTQIGSCDFSSESYSYVKDNDSTLKNVQCKT